MSERETFWSFIQAPLRGQTSLSKVFWLYGIAGSACYSAIGLLFDAGNEIAMRIYVIGGLIFTVYVTLATYQCAGNSRSVALARFVRILAVISLLLLPLFAYLGFSGALDLTSLRGEQ
jgi:hypothetical protein